MGKSHFYRQNRRHPSIYAGCRVCFCRYFSEHSDNMPKQGAKVGRTLIVLIGIQFMSHLIFPLYFILSKKQRHFCSIFKECIVSRMLRVISKYAQVQSVQTNLSSMHADCCLKHQGVSSKEIVSFLQLSVRICMLAE